MKHLVTLLIASMLLSACGASDSETNNTDNGGGDIGRDDNEGGGTFTQTHSVCAYEDDDSDNGDSVLLASKALDESQDPLLIDSMSQAGSDMDIEALPEDQQFDAAFAITAFTAPILADAFATINLIYACTDAIYALNQCNWELDNIKVETQLGFGQSYITTVSTPTEGQIGFQQSQVIEGTVGDLGNMTFNMYEDGLNVGTRQTTRTDDGTETVRWTSTDTNWVATETSNCTGSIEYQDIREDGTINIDAQWSFDGSTSTGTYDFEKTGETNLSITIDW